ncbi:PrsW family glutamic-type intramembrane protease [Demequina pelophila]|uniref:PrsW family glutamic-type intramembrane protease n=1 Tax=Demequina pelophila TaxID=1638984 RepID=UPI00078360B8|nr:PrsW family glutamic-type intramembrane protease [Demequina pelophila]
MTNPTPSGATAAPEASTPSGAPAVTSAASAEPAVSRVARIAAIATTVAAAVLTGLYLWHMLLRAQPLDATASESGSLLLHHPAAAGTAIVLAIAASVIAASYVGRSLRRFGTPLLLGLGLLWGMGAPVVVGQVEWLDPMSPAGAVAGPVIEEVVKASLLVGVALLAGRLIASPVRGALLGWAVGLGFMLTENLQYFLNFLVYKPEGSGDGWIAVAVRSVSTLTGGHYVYTALVGLAIGAALARGGRLRLVGATAAGLGLAAVVHVAANMTPLAAIVLLVITILLARRIRRAATREATPTPEAAPAPESDPASAATVRDSVDR